MELEGARRSAAKHARTMNRSFFSSLLFTLLFCLAGCGSGGSDAVAGGDSPLPLPLPPESTTTVRLQNTLQRAVPTNVTTLRLSAFDGAGALRFGPQARAKAAVLDFPGVPLSVTRIHVEYLENDVVVGLAVREVDLRAGEIALLSDLDFSDVEQLLVALRVVPVSLQLTRGSEGRLRAEGVYGDGSSLDLTSLVLWSSAEGVARVDEDGAVSAVEVGTSEVTATYGALSARGRVVVTGATLTGIVFEPTSVTLPLGLSQDLSVQARFSDESTTDITTQATFSSSSSAVAVSASGRVTANSLGTAAVSATYQGSTASISVTASAATLQSLSVTPSSMALPAGLTGRFRYQGVLSDGGSSYPTVSWESSSPSVATVDSEGNVVAHGPGNATITASSGAVSSTATLMVGAAEFAFLEEVPLGLRGDEIAVADLDGNGREDYIVSGRVDLDGRRYPGMQIGHLGEGEPEVQVVRSDNSIFQLISDSSPVLGRPWVGTLPGDSEASIVARLLAGSFSSATQFRLYPGAGGPSQGYSPLAFPAYALPVVSPNSFNPDIVSGGQQFAFANLGGEGGPSLVALARSAQGTETEVFALTATSGGSPVREAVRLAVDLTSSGGPLAVTTGLVAGDFDEDGLDDLLTYGSLGDDVLFHRNDGDGGFTRSTSSAQIGETNFVRDFDGDGHLDILSLYRFSASYSLVLNLGDGEGGFSTGSTVASFGLTPSVALADFDGDGDEDVVFATSRGVRLVPHGSDGFVSRPDSSLEGPGGAVAALDWDGDGKKDALVVDGTTLKVYRNVMP